MLQCIDDGQHARCDGYSHGRKHGSGCSESEERRAACGEQTSRFVKLGTVCIGGGERTKVPACHKADPGRNEQLQAAA
jgi:hypothetical protein